MALKQNRFCPQPHKRPINVGENKWHIYMRRSIILEKNIVYLNGLLPLDRFIRLIYLYYHMVVGDGTLFDQIMDLPLPQIYGAVWRFNITEVWRRSSGIQDVREPPGARKWGVATCVKELGLVDAEGDRGLAEASVAGSAARGLGAGGGARGPWAGRV
jgi:hypothetical protein